MAYVIEHGDVWFRTEGVTQMIHVSSGSEMLAIAYDCEDGTMHKRGSYKNVQAWVEKTQSKFRVHGYDDIADCLVIAMMPANKKSSTRDDINYVASFSGAMAASCSDASVDEMAPGDLETAKLFGKRVAEVTAKFKK